MLNPPFGCIPTLLRPHAVGTLTFLKYYNGDVEYPNYFEVSIHPYIESLVSLYHFIKTFMGVWSMIKILVSFYSLIDGRKKQDLNYKTWNCISDFWLNIWSKLLAKFRYQQFCMIILFPQLYYYDFQWGRELLLCYVSRLQIACNPFKPIFLQIEPNQKWKLMFGNFSMKVFSHM